MHNLIEVFAIIIFCFSCVHENEIKCLIMVIVVKSTNEVKLIMLRCNEKFKICILAEARI
jgi:hypothetical protein